MPDLTERLRAVLSDRYDVGAEVGAGGMAVVFRARDLRHERNVAIKVMRPELSLALGHDRFLRETRLAAGLQHPHIVPVYDSGAADPLLYYVMPLVEGESLRARLQRDECLSVSESVRIASEVADALQYAHDRGIVHRDIKPENILLSGGHALVTDFGIARAISAASGQQSLTQTGIAVGTPIYMSPEQLTASRDIDGRSDVYSLGCVLYEMLRGQPPFKGPAAKIIVDKLTSGPTVAVRQLRGDLPQPLKEILIRALAPSAEDRFTTAAELRDALVNVVSGPSSATSIESHKLRSGRRRILVAAGAIAAIAVIAMATPPVRNAVKEFSWRSRAPSRPPVRLLVADIDATPGDRVAASVKEILISTLNDSKLVATVSQDELATARRDAMIPDTARLEGERARHVALRGGAHTVIEGRAERSGPRYNILLRAIDVQDGTLVASANASVAENALVPTVERLARDIRDRIAVSTDTTSVPRRAGAATPSFKAYRLFLDALSSDNPRKAVTLLREAIALDADFAEAWHRLGAHYRQMGPMPDSVRFAYAQAQRTASRLTARERLIMEAEIARFINGDGSTAPWDRVLQEDPEYAPAHAWRAVSFIGAGEYDQAIESCRRAVKLTPAPHEMIASECSEKFANAGLFAEARSLARHLQGGGRENAEMQIAISAAQFATVDSIGRDWESDPTEEMTWRSYGAVLQASAQAARGQVRSARESLQRSARLFPARRHNDSQMQLLLWSASGQRPSEEIQLAGHDTTSLYLWGEWAAYEGDTLTVRRARRTVAAKWSDPENVAKWKNSGKLPSQASLSFNLFEATIAANSGRWADVIRSLAPAAWQGCCNQSYSSGALIRRRWLVADAYERMGKLDSAAVYFELLVTPKRIDWRSIMFRGLTHSFALRRLALLHTRMGHPDRARVYWQQFADTFTAPDAELRPMLAEARAALANTR